MMIMEGMEEILRKQRENCYRSLGNLPGNLKKSYYDRIMNADVPQYDPDSGAMRIVVYAAFALTGAMAASIIYAII